MKGLVQALEKHGVGLHSIRYLSDKLEVILFLPYEFAETRLMSAVIQNGVQCEIEKFYFGEDKCRIRGEQGNTFGRQMNIRLPKEQYDTLVENIRGLRTMMGLYVKITNDCNLRCTYCYNHKKIGTHKDSTINVEYVKKLISMTAKKYEDIHIFFIGGEPLTVPMEVYEEIFEYCRTFPDTNFYYSTQSNITLVNKKWIDFAEKYDFRLSGSFDGLSTPIQRCEMNMVTNKIRLLSANHHDLGYIMVGTKRVLDNIIEEYEFAKNYIKLLKINTLRDSLGNKAYRDLYIDKMIELAEHWILDSNPIEIGQFVYMCKMIRGEIGEYYRNCDRAWIGIDNKGYIDLCEFSVDLNKIMEPHHIAEYDRIEDILERSERLSYIRTMCNRERRCREVGCPVAGLCNGDCIVDILRTYGSLTSVGNENGTCIMITEFYTRFKNLLFRYKDKLPNHVKDCLGEEGLRNLLK